MTLMLRNALGPWREFDRFFGPTEHRTRWSPRFDVTETETAYVLRGDIPGVSQKDLEVRLDEGILSVRGERKAEPSDSRLHRGERPAGSFERWFRLPGEVKQDKVEATYKRGVLTLTVPKQEPVDTSRLIPVQ